MDCPGYEELAAFGDRTLSPESVESVALHVATCADCAAVLEKLLLQQNSPPITLSGSAAEPFVHMPQSQGGATKTLDPLDKPPELSTETLPHVSTPAGDQPTLTYHLPAPLTVKREKLGRYENLGVIKKGGMGIIYRARDPVLDRTVALKMIKGVSVAREEELQRFLLEAKSVAQLKHENIVKIHEFGQIEEQPYFTMEVAEYGSLLDQLDRFQKDRKASVSLLAKVARAVHYIHQHNMIHRDLKPGNILLEDNYKPVVSDFGLAKWLEGEADLTQPGGVVGTAAYMAPEQFTRPDDAAGLAVDIWALGVILYELLTGQKPFSGRKWEDYSRSVASTEPPRPRTLNPHLPYDLETIILKCLEKKPGSRFASASDLADELERWLRGEPILSRRLPLVARLGRWCRRHPVRTISVAVLVVAMSLGFFLADRFDPQRPIKTMQTQLRQGQSVPLLEGDRLKWLDWPLGPTALLPHEGKADYISFRAYNYSCLGVFPDPRIPAYRFRAKVRHEGMRNGSSSVGLVFCLGRYQGRQGPFLGFCSLTFNDLHDRRAALAAKGVPKAAVQGNPVETDLRFFRNFDKLDAPNSWVGRPSLPLKPLFFQPSLKGEGTGPWRDLAVEATPESITIFFEQQRGSVLSRKELLESVKAAIHANEPDLDLAKIHLGTGLALFCFDGMASFKEIVLEPITE